MHLPVSSESNPKQDEHQKDRLDTDNFSRLGLIFNWMSVSDIDDQNMFYMAQKLGITLKSEDVWIKSTWNVYKQYTIFTIHTKELFFIKRLWERYFLREILGLHLACYIFDPELFVFNYLAGTYQSGFWRKEPTPYLMTIYVHGDDISPEFKRDPKHPLWYWFGRHYYLHLILSLYDVENRHFKVSNQVGTVKRLDLGLSFRHIERDYDGFREYFGALRYEDNSSFQQGVQFEKEMVSTHLSTTRPSFLRIMKGFAGLKQDNLVDFDPDLFCRALKIYWEKNVPELRLSKGW